ncbi:intraflagellar transport protein 25 homolog isoform X1 [Tachysurus fulvidraco]|uniref:intraflagellar transport protein 25 homolog isoform X1 n=1 Tax=Tachysurus fulvidraco TaxID=1234273 RepID=UPI001FEE5B2E|nr:intraflagellar transport protein 25 homolog isoform X1 [Tachysurus fulvidraco]XP_047674668.1 intraflagellar transport protein 25 homolog isoform X1 [Tachysurus fulvidraco]
MLNTALSSFGAQVVLAASSDENHLPENMIDGNTETFWMSTGMFPQEFIIRFPDNMKISVISVHSFNVKRLRIEKSTQAEAEKFEVMTETEFEQTEGSLQTNEIAVSFFVCLFPLLLSNAYLKRIVLCDYIIISMCFFAAGWHQCDTSEVSHPVWI